MYTQFNLFIRKIHNEKNNIRSSFNRNINKYPFNLTNGRRTQNSSSRDSGLNGGGGQNINYVLPYFGKNKLKHNVPTPKKNADFGQTNCLNLLKEKINFLKNEDIIRDNDQLLFHASSQGTATTINYVANNPNNIKGLILEGLMLTGNSAVSHTVKNIMDVTNAHYYTLPYVAQLFYPDYFPTGEQPILNADKLPTDLPIIIIHDTQDFQLPFADALALYAFLTKVKKNKYVYLFAQKSQKGEHILLLQKNRNGREVAAITTILQLHHLLPPDPEVTFPEPQSDQEWRDQLFTVTKVEYNIDLNDYQPEPQQEWLDHFYKILDREQNFENMSDYMCEIM